MKGNVSDLQSESLFLSEVFANFISSGVAQVSARCSLIEPLLEKIPFPPPPRSEEGEQEEEPGKAGVTPTASLNGMRRSEKAQVLEKAYPDKHTCSGAEKP